MAKPKPVPAPVQSDDTPPWLALLFVGLTGVLIGATGTYFVLRPQLQRSAPAPTQLAAPGNAGMPADHAPPPSLTAGKTPAQADRALGNFHYDHGNWPLAQKHYEAAIRQGEDDADIRTDLGNVYRFSGRAQEALTQYELAQRMNPQHEFSLFNQGGLFLEEFKDPVRAVAAWNDYLRRFPNGRNAEITRQLIAQANGGAAPGPTAAPGMPPTGPRPLDPTEQRLLELVKEPKKP
jgi:tetratricopeptide (TPR) repeat protein